MKLQECKSVLAQLVVSCGISTQRQACFSIQVFGTLMIHDQTSMASHDMQAWRSARQKIDLRTSIDNFFNKQAVSQERRFCRQDGAL
ncbi:hypothetical protein [Herbaspirillum sp. CF444]|uniref:hypothetical protein n=1 Tax=Herbaspirillum sp. CF444 TaxID=1144319 RepID=UPI00054E072A|nr:hypothetical protein [Herbaspirillum sp. CF444]